MDDDRIVQLFLDRDEEAIRQTAQKYGTRLRTIAWNITSDRETAGECENDTYLEAWNCIPPSEPKDYLFPFLARITRSLSIDRCRERTRLKRQGHIVTLTDELAACIPALGDAEDGAEAKLLGEAISRFLYTLPDEKRVMFIRRYYFLDSVSEVAGRLSVSDSKVKTTLFRIRSDLRKYLNREGYTI